MNVPVVSHLKLLVNLYNKMNNRFLVLLVIYLIIYLLSVLYKNKQIFCAILLSLLSWERGLKCLHIPRSSPSGVSLLSWERGLKLASCSEVFKSLSQVAPLVGAWIEICAMTSLASASTSLLSWERGLKLRPPFFAGFLAVVAPLVGAWIEIEGICAFIGQESCRSSRGSVD